MKAGNFSSNINHLYEHWDEQAAAKHADIVFHIYVPGIGTTNKEKDSTLGMALGNDSFEFAGYTVWEDVTGVIAKVEKGIDEIVEEIHDRTTGKGKNIEYIHLDVYGFSRGAAAARYFVYAALVRPDTKLLTKLVDYKIGHVKVKFVGLFDTVASYVRRTSFTYKVDHSNDTEELHLNAIAQAEKVIQLAAADEHRVNYPLTNINSAANGSQVFLPGGHSDIGGGYTEESGETDKCILCFRSYHIVPYAGYFIDDTEEKNRLAREQQRLIASGWYRKTEIQQQQEWIRRGDCEYHLVVNRPHISNKYSNIPLQTMADRSAVHEVNFFGLKEKHPIPVELSDVKVIIDDYVAQHVSGNAVSKASDWIDRTDAISKRLRHDHLHFTACYDHAWTLESVFDPDQPRFKDNDSVKALREREIFNG